MRVVQYNPEPLEPGTARIATRWDEIIEPDQRRPFFVAGHRVGAVREDLFALVSRLDTHFERRGRGLALSDRFAS